MHHITRINALDVLCIEHEHFSAELTLQGAQLIKFSTAQQPQNWLFVSEANTYEAGSAIRGGVPICWPIFGAYDKNPDTVKNSFRSPLSNHGFARHALWDVISVESKAHSVIATLALAHADYASRAVSADDPEHTQTQPLPQLDARVHFFFDAQGVTIALTTENHAPTTVSFSQALHTYLATDAIAATRITGFEDARYADALTADWTRKTQSGDITFSEEVDRVYQHPSICDVHCPQTTYQMQAKGSNSTVVWNPWIEKSQRLSHFEAHDYQRMVCVETANALDDVVTLAPNQTHTLSVRITTATKATTKTVAKTTSIS